jgi:hypothetical protein
VDSCEHSTKPSDYINDLEFSFSLATVNLSPCKLVSSTEQAETNVHMTRRIVFEDLFSTSK